MTHPMSRPLLPEWQDWLTSNVVQGVADAQLVKTMTENGFDENYSLCAIAVVRSMTERVQKSNPELLKQYSADPIRLAATGAKIRAADRDVYVAFTLANPNIAVLENLLSPDECTKLIQLSRGKLTRSEVVKVGTGHQEASKVRTSEGTHFGYAENAVVQRYEARLEALFGKPVNEAEPLQILHYHTGGEYLAHHDYFEPSDPGTAVHTAKGGQRVATLVTYLADVQAGGETVFPELDLSIRPRAGTGVYFEYHNASGQLDGRCLHAGVPVQKGEKWVATKWFRERAYV
jgi:prolyl 4-hydroxylase